ncbi:MAG: HPP family protein, partial [Candidatus Sericytochromatia bacterium]
VMTRKVVCVLESTTIEQVASLCNRRGFSGVPVVSQNQSLIGIVTMSDIMQQLIDKKSLSTYSEQGGEVLEQKALAILDEPVRNYMHSQVITVPPETTVREACQLMMKHRIRRLVVSRGDLVRGIFSAQDAVRVLATAELKVEAEA